MHNFTLAELINGLRNNKFSSVELTQHFLNRIKELNGDYNAIITITASQALESAISADQRLANGLSLIHI